MVRVPEVRKAAVWLQDVPRVVCTNVRCHPTALRFQSTLPVVWAVTRARASTAASPKASLHMRGLSTSPSSAPRSLGIGRLLARHEMKHDASTPLAQRAWEGNGRLLLALRSMHHTKTVVLISFDSGQRRGQGSGHPLVSNALVKNGKSLGSALRPNFELSHRCHEG